MQMLHLSVFQLGCRLTRSPGSRGPRQTRFNHQALAKSKGRETSGDETGKDIISGRSTLKDSLQSAEVSLGSHKENARQMSIGTYLQVGSKDQISHSLGVSNVGFCLLLEG